MALLNFLFPPTCGLCARPCPTAAEFCGECLLSFVPAAAVAHVPGLDAVVSPWLYGGQLAVAIERLKYHRQLPCAVGLAAAIKAPLAATVAAWQPDAVIAVPMTLGRALRRGIVHASLLLEHAIEQPARHLLAPRLLCRVRGGRPQAQMSRAERLVNLVDAFAARRTLHGARVLVFDDVMTTGATLAACADACKQAGAAAVIGFVAAYND